MRTRQCGQAAVEALVLVPVLVGIAFGAWQLAAYTSAAMDGYGDLSRTAAERGPTARGAHEVTRRVPSIIPGVGPLPVVVRVSPSTR